MTRKIWVIGGAAVAALIAAGYAYSAKAADLGGSCCADLEERVAELEATVARKGNRKMRLTISGEVSKALLWHDIAGLAGADKIRVIDNPNSGTKVRFVGEGQLSPGMKAGFLVEIGIDETAGNLLGVGSAIADFTIRHSNVWLEGAVGKITVGRASTATDGIVEVDLANTNIASLPMSVEPMWTYSGIPGLGLGIVNPVGFDGSRANVVRYDTPTLGGFTAAASWGGGQSASGDDAWDAALRYAAEFSGFRIAAGAGYRVEKLATFGATDMKTLAGSASLMHVTSGLFANLAAGQQDDHPLWGDVQMWHAKAGFAKNFTGLGQTTIFGEYADHKLKSLAVDSTFWGAGIVQSIDAGAIDIFASYRQYDLGGVFDASVGMVGARVKF
jgi:predicted porin